MFSVLIPTWNNLPHLRLCVEGLRENSVTEPEIVVHVNEGRDGTREWLTAQGIPFSFTEKNAGVCVALNEARKRASRPWLVFMNDDMYPLPGWDTALEQAIRNADPMRGYFSATMIEPRDTRNPCVVVRDFGSSPDDFRKAELIAEQSRLVRKDWNGASWPPSVVSAKLWDSVGGYDESFSPGMSSDPDFSMKLWRAGVRDFHGVGDSLVYHFQAKSTGRVIRNDGRRQFLHKWGINQRVFYRHYLRMGTDYRGPLAEPVAGPGLAWGIAKSKLRRLWQRLI